MTGTAELEGRALAGLRGQRRFQPAQGLLSWRAGLKSFIHVSLSFYRRARLKRPRHVSDGPGTRWQE